jgi:hypothetical protein
VNKYMPEFSRSARQTFNSLTLPFALFITYHEPLQVANLRVKDTGMDLRGRILFSFFIRIESASLDCSRLEKVDALFNDIEFHQSTMTLFRILNGVQFNTVETVSGERMMGGVEWIIWRV